MICNAEWEKYQRKKKEGKKNTVEERMLSRNHSNYDHSGTMTIATTTKAKANARAEAMAKVACRLEYPSSFSFAYRQRMIDANMTTHMHSIQTMSTIMLFCLTAPYDKHYWKIRKHERVCGIQSQQQQKHVYSAQPQKAPWFEGARGLRVEDCTRCE